MFVIDDLWKILNSLRGESVPELDATVKILADSEKSKVKSFFETTLDQPSFSTDDYKRLRTFLIDLFASHRTISTIQKQISDVFSLPITSLDELINSFGYSIALDKLDDVTKATFFLDLVNLYKLKGTPAGLVQVLSYYGLSNVELVEYWLMKDEDSELVFKGINVLEENKLLIPWSDIEYDLMILGDPHWLLTKTKAEQAIAATSIALPSKSPYIGIRPKTFIWQLEAASIILSWKVQNDFELWQSSGIKPTKDLLVSLLNYMVSFLELYLGCVYAINTQYGLINGNTTDPFLCYNGSNTTIDDILEEYITFINDRPISRDDRDQKVLDYITLFTKPAIEKFAQTKAEVATYLEDLDPDFKDLIDMWIGFGHGEDLVIGLMNELATWVSLNIDVTFTNFAASSLGISSLAHIREVMEFFKPYRARIKDLEHAYIFDDKIRDCILVEDLGPGTTPITEIETHVDFDTANSQPGWLENWLPPFDYITSTPLAGEYLVKDIYLDASLISDSITELVPVDSTSVYIYSTPASGQYRVTNIYLIDGWLGTKRLVIEYESSPTTTPGVSTLIISNPKGANSYKVIDIKRDSLGRFVIEYDTIGSAFPWHNIDRKYYSRETYDCGSYFDIGAAYDIDPRDPFGPSWVEIYFRDEIHDYLNNHPSDSTSYVHFRYTENPLEPNPFLKVTEVTTFGGFVNFDEDWIFDSPFVSDVCMISVGPPPP